LRVTPKPFYGRYYTQHFKQIDNFLRTGEEKNIRLIAQKTPMVIYLSKQIIKFMRVFLLDLTNLLGCSFPRNCAVTILQQSEDFVQAAALQLNLIRGGNTPSACAHSITSYCHTVKTERRA